MMCEGGAVYYFHYDGRGNVTSVTDSAGNTVAAYRYDAFCRLIAKTGSFDQPIRFSTKRYDDETGLYYYGYRCYSPALGHWLTRDPLGEAGGINLYWFVGNNPVNYYDPWGLWSVSLEGYYGGGGEFVFGKNPGGGYFLAFRYGYGIGGGVSYNPQGTSSDWDPFQNCGPMNVGVGGCGGASVGLGPAYAGVSGNVGVNVGGAVGFDEIRDLMDDEGNWIETGDKKVILITIDQSLLHLICDNRIPVQ